MKLTASLDTNVLVRLIVKDDAAQTQAAVLALSKMLRQSQRIGVALTVMLELEWVLRSRYKFSKAEVVKTFSELMMTVELAFASEAALEQALVWYEEGDADFAEYLHLAQAHQLQGLPFLTFDVKAAKASGAKLLK